MSDIYGTRARIGVVVPADNVVTEPEMYASAPSGVSFHVSRIRTEERSQMRADGVRCARSLALAGVDALAYACSETSAVDGGASDAFITELSRAASAPAITATAAIAAQLESLGLEKLVLVTPYLADYGAQVEAAYRERGFAIVQAHHRAVAGAPERPEWWATNRQTPDQAAAPARSVDVSGADCLVLPATNVPLLPALEALHADRGLPVLTGNGALLWWCLEACNRAVRP